MFRTSVTTRVLDGGGIEIVDPDMESIPLLKAIDPAFRIRRARLENYSSPRFLVSRDKMLAIKPDDLGTMETDELWHLHEKPVTHPGSGVSLLDLKVELARRELKNCRICGRNCGVNRLAGEKGVCGLGAESTVAECFVHVVEEPPINPSLNINLRGCGLQCRFCQKHGLINPRGDGISLNAAFWGHLKSGVARSVSFVGGNPDESVYSVLQFLTSAPSWFKKPVVWNSNGYGNKNLYRLLHGIVDAYIPDMKFFGRECSQNLADCPDYFPVFAEGLKEMVQQDVPVIVRILILPGHSDCCHVPLVDHLSRYRDKVTLNVFNQYYPNFMISAYDGDMAGIPDRSEAEYIRSYAKTIGSRDWLIRNAHERL